MLSCLKLDAFSLPADGCGEWVPCDACLASSSDQHFSIQPAFAWPRQHNALPRSSFPMQTLDVYLSQGDQQFGIQTLYMERVGVVSKGAALHLGRLHSGPRVGSTHRLCAWSGWGGVQRCAVDCVVVLHFVCCKHPLIQCSPCSVGHVSRVCVCAGQVALLMYNQDTGTLHGVWSADHKVGAAPLSHLSRTSRRRACTDGSLPVPVVPVLVPV